MKTPRQILLERHRAAETKLDRIRQDVVAQSIAPSRVTKPSPHPRPTIDGRRRASWLGSGWN